MEYLKEIIDLLLHVDLKLQALILQYGAITYVILFLIVFCETGLVVTPFLPGDSLLFAAGAFAAAGAFELPLLMLVLFAAAVLGDMVNYWIGYHIGPKIFFKENGLFLKKSHLDKTHAFYERYGGKTIIIARFVPIVRTFAPFVAGIGRMSYRKFSVYNIAGAALWILSFTTAGYLFGNLPMVKKNFTLVILAIIILSILPGVIEYIRQRRTSAATPDGPQG